MLPHRERVIRPRSRSLSPGTAQTRRKCECCCQQTNPNDFFGLNRFHDKSYSLLSKFVWFLVIISCFTVCIYQIADRVTIYLEGPIVTEVKLEQRTSITFPSITLCNSDLYYLIINKQLNNDSFNGTSQLWTTSDMRLEDLLVKTMCEKKFVQKQSCIRPVAELMIIATVNTMIGSCTMLTMKNKLDFKGHSTGFGIIWNKTKPSLISNNTKFNFFIHQDNFHHVHDYIFNLEIFKLNHSTLYRAYSKEIYNLNTSRNPCDTEENAFACSYNCINKELVKVITCGLPFVNSTNELAECTFEELLANYEKLFPIVFNMSQYLKICKCKRKCNETQYVLHKGITIKTDDNSTALSLRVHGDKNELLIEKEMFTVSALFSDIGGTIGLYLGISVFTVIDLMETLIRQNLRSFNKK